MKTLRQWSIVGMALIFILGWLLHSAFEWSNQNRLVAMIAPVNESVWEHLKLGWGGLLLFSAFEYRFVRKSANNYFLAKLSAVVCISFTIIFIYYSYTYFLQRSIIIVDILSYAIGVIIGQRVSLYLYLKTHQPIINQLSIAQLVLIAIAFAWCTFNPPHSSLFMDMRTSSYGIPSTR